MIPVFYRNKRVGNVEGEIKGMLAFVPMCSGVMDIFIITIRLKYCIVNGVMGARIWFKKDLELCRQSPAFVET